MNNEMAIQTCTSCGGAIFTGTGTFGWGGKICYCVKQEMLRPQSPLVEKQFGWTCPHCSKTYSPQTAYCSCLIQEKL